MITPQKVFLKIIGSIDWVDLSLLVFNSGIGLAIADYLGYEINWVISVYFILWIILFYLGSEILWNKPNRSNSEKDITFQRLMTSVCQLLTILFMSLSILPLIQIIIVLFNNSLVVYLISILSFWMLIKVFFEQRTRIFGISESISSFMICFITPLILININGIQIHEILLPISFFSFLQIIANKLIRETFELEKETMRAAFTSSFVGIHSIVKLILVLVVFGYVACILLIYLQDRMQIIRPLWFTLPFAALFVFKIYQISGNQIHYGVVLTQFANTFVLFIEITWIIGLWLG